MLLYLRYNHHTFDWITDFVRTHKSIASPREFHLTDADYASFSQWMVDKKFDYDRQSSKELAKLEELAKFEGYYSRSKEEFERLKAILVPDLKHDLEFYRPQIEQYLTTAILARYYYNRGSLERSVREDKTVETARALLEDTARYRSLLTPKKSADTATKPAQQ